MYQQNQAGYDRVLVGKPGMDVDTGNHSALESGQESDRMDESH